MTNISRSKRLAIPTVVAAVLLFASGSLFGTQAQQRDPFKKAGFATPRKVSPTAAAKAKAKVPAAPVNYGPPPIEARIDYYKRLRETAAANGTPLPKVTSVLTLNEMTVTGIFKTPRGYAAMIEATPIKLSYTIYPGEKFFDGQLVAVEENRLVFRKVAKVGEGKFVATVENKPLRQYSDKQQIEGTAPATPTEKERPIQTASVPENSKAADPKAAKAAKPSNPFLSPLDEMNSQPEKSDVKDKKNGKVPVKVASNKGHKRS